MRRTANALLAGISALLPIMAGASAQPVAATAPQSAFTPPDGGMVLLRELRRALPDGKEIRSRRTYEIRITRQGSGFRVDGRLIRSEIDAPPSLRALAQIERNRPDNALFPMMLDGNGMLVPHSRPASTADRGEPAGLDDAARHAAQLVTTQLVRSRLGSGEQADVAAFVEQLVAPGSNAGSQWPRDLFRPQAGLRSETRRFSLPGGDAGSITMAIDARTASSGGLLDTLERTIITETGITQTGASQRITRELWQLRAENLLP